MARVDASSTAVSEAAVCLLQIQSELCAGKCFFVMCPKLLPFVQVVIFVKNAKRAQTLAALLEKCQFPATYITAQMEQKKRLDVYR